MIRHLVRLSIRYAGVVVALALLVVVYGVYRLFNADLNVFPEFSPSQVVIQTEAPGLSAELVETQVTARIEAALAEEGATAMLVIVNEDQLAQFRLPVSCKADFVVHGASAAECATRILRGFPAPALRVNSNAGPVAGGRDPRGTWGKAV